MCVVWWNMGTRGKASTIGHPGQWGHVPCGQQLLGTQRSACLKVITLCRSKHFRCHQAVTAVRSRADTEAAMAMPVSICCQHACDDPNLPSALQGPPLVAALAVLSMCKQSPPEANNAGLKRRGCARVSSFCLISSISFLRRSQTRRGTWCLPRGHVRGDHLLALNRLSKRRPARYAAPDPLHFTVLPTRARPPGRGCSSCGDQDLNHALDLLARPRRVSLPCSTSWCQAGGAARWTLCLQSTLRLPLCQPGLAAELWKPRYSVQQTDLPLF
jgi:hypothetical protein